MHYVLLPPIHAEHGRRRAGVATLKVGATEVRQQALNVELQERSGDVEAVSRRLGAVHTRMVKGPIQRGESSDH